MVVWPQKLSLRMFKTLLSYSIRKLHLFIYTYQLGTQITYYATLLVIYVTLKCRVWCSQFTTLCLCSIWKTQSIYIYKTNVLFTHGWGGGGRARPTRVILLIWLWCCQFEPPSQKGCRVICSYLSPVDRNIANLVPSPIYYLMMIQRNKQCRFTAQWRYIADLKSAGETLFLLNGDTDQTKILWERKLRAYLRYSENSEPIGSPEQTKILLDIQSKLRLHWTQWHTDQTMILFEIQSKLKSFWS